MEKLSAVPNSMRGVGSRLLFFFACVSLALYGLFFIYSTGYISEAYPVRDNWERQCMFLVLGTISAFFLAGCNKGRKAWEIFVASGYCCSVLGLLLVLLAGTRAGGAQRWLNMGLFLIQPAEFAKLFTILFVALVLSKISKWYVAVAGVLFLVAVPFILIFIEPSYGNAFSIIPSVAAMLLHRYSNAKLIFFAYCFMLFLCLAYVCGLAWLRTEDGKKASADFFKARDERVLGLRPYHVKRLKNYLDARGDWNERQAVVTIATGGLTGKGYLQGTMKSLGFLPRTVAPTDFIFSVICEELGLLYGTIPILTLFSVIVVIGLHWAGRAKNMLDAMTAISITTLLFTHISINLGMSVRLLPIMGLPLPLLSYGGSYVIATLAALGILASTAAQHDSYAKKSNDIMLKIGPFASIDVKITNQ